MRNIFKRVKRQRRPEGPSRDIVDAQETTGLSSDSDSIDSNSDSDSDSDSGSRVTHRRRKIPATTIIPDSSSFPSGTHDAATSVLSDSSRLEFQSMFIAAWNEYKEQTGTDPTTHPLFIKIDQCASVNDVLGLLNEQATEFGDFRKAYIFKWLKPLVNILLPWKDVLGEGVGMVSLFLRRIHFAFGLFMFQSQTVPSAKAIFGGVGILLQVFSQCIH